jgi:hypothetical protein
MIYISGRITGNKNWKEEFNQAEKYLRSCTNDDIINPLGLSAIVEELFSTPKWRDYMKVCVRELLHCDTIYMLLGWRRSKGARLERKIAKAFGMKIIYQRKKERNNLEN